MSHYLKFQSLTNKKTSTSQIRSVRKSLLFAGGITLKTETKLVRRTQRHFVLNVVLDKIIVTNLRVNIQRNYLKFLITSEHLEGKSLQTKDQVRRFYKRTRTKLHKHKFFHFHSMLRM
jgi:hypothetical protein